MLNQIKGAIGPVLDYVFTRNNWNSLNVMLNPWKEATTKEVYKGLSDETIKSITNTVADTVGKTLRKHANHDLQNALGASLFDKLSTYLPKDTIKITLNSIAKDVTQDIADQASRSVGQAVLTINARDLATSLLAATKQHISTTTTETVIKYRSLFDPKWRQLGLEYLVFNKLLYGRGPVTTLTDTAAYLILPGKKSIGDWSVRPTDGGIIGTIWHVMYDWTLGWAFPRTEPSIYESSPAIQGLSYLQNSTTKMTSDMIQNHGTTMAITAGTTAAVGTGALAYLAYQKGWTTEGALYATASAVSFVAGSVGFYYATSH